MFHVKQLLWHSMITVEVNMKRRIAILINPVAGKGKAIESLPKIKSFFEPYSDEIELIIKVSKCKNDLMVLTKECIEQDIFDFIALGGDGTLFEVINGIPSEDEIIEKVSIALLPLGSGNDFVKSFRSRHSLDMILQNVIDNKKIKVDCGRVNEFKFINSCTFGIDGPIIQKTDQLKDKLNGKAAYMMSTLSTALHYKAPVMKVTIDNLTIEKPILLLAIGNGRFIGGGMDVFPDSKYDDGILDVCMVEDVSLLKFLKEFKKIYAGKLSEINEVHYFKAKEVKIETITGMAFINADGNLVGTDPAQISLSKTQINFYN